MYEIFINLIRGGGYFPLSILAYLLGIYLFDFVFNRNSLNFSDSKFRIVLFIEFITGILLTWGSDVLQRQYEVENLRHALMVALGIYLLIVLPVELRHHVNSSFSSRKFWLDFRKYLAGYFLCSMTVYFCS
jgi:hypothetical protein